jgi:hypothetical protein
MYNKKVWDKMIEIHWQPQDWDTYLFKALQLDWTTKAWRESSDLVYWKTLKEMEEDREVDELSWFNNIEWTI